MNVEFTKVPFWPVQYTAPPFTAAELFTNVAFVKLPLAPLQLTAAPLPTLFAFANPILEMFTSVPLTSNIYQELFAFIVTSPKPVMFIGFVMFKLLSL